MRDGLRQEAHPIAATLPCTIKAVTQCPSFRHPDLDALYVSILILNAIIGAKQWGRL
jgi:hypothetical protein